MDYIQIIIPSQNLTPELLEIVIAKLSDFSIESFEEADDALIAYVPEKRYNRKAVTSFLNDMLLLYKENTIKQKNWNAQWESSFKEVRLDDKVLIKADFHKSKNLPGVVINIHPKMAFGTGHHETTRLMIRHMLKIPLRGKTVLDWGTGSGILAIMAEKQKAKSVLAVDTDMLAVDNARDNVNINECKRIVVKQGGLDIPGKNDAFDVILANINKNTLIDNASCLTGKLKKNAHLLLSGFLVSDVNDIGKAFEQHGLKFEQLLTENDWCAAWFSNDSTS
ncbi:MAG: 50S ribosomal protein L11 methyltransferase [Candidatus Delongbacteria bacterium]|jgi:ribosomal protein L11 methyltransferase|nr:50S ribosomal protein L11 methyltransferase [Candidatus Delongbacteria bacterium]